MKLTITEEHLRVGKRMNGAECPVALAVGAILKSGLTVNVSSRHIFIFSDQSAESSYKEPLSPQGEMFLTRFDYGDHSGISPCELEVDIPEQFLK